LTEDLWFIQISILLLLFFVLTSLKRLSIQYV
jgi:hypothetical protein